MRSLLSRLAFWWAAPAAVLSLFLPAPLGLWLAGAAALAAAISLSMRGRWKLPVDPVRPDPAAPVDLDGLHDLSVSLVRCAREACDLGEALHGSARLLVQELGAKGLVTGRIDKHGAARRDGRPAHATAEPLSAVAAQAVALKQVVGGRDIGYAVPVVQQGCSVAWLEFGQAELNIDHAALLHLLDVLGGELSVLAAQGAVAAPAADAALAGNRSAAAVACAQSFVAASCVAAQAGPHPMLVLYTQRCAAQVPAPASEAAGGPGFDPAAIERLRELDADGQNRLLQRVVKAFETSTARLLPQLTGAAHAGDLGAVRLFAHSLKSASASVGAIKLTGLCAEIEAMTPAEQDQDLPACVGALTRETEIVLDVVRSVVGVSP